MEKSGFEPEPLATKEFSYAACYSERQGGTALDDEAERDLGITSLHLRAGLNWGLPDVGVDFHTPQPFGGLSDVSRLGSGPGAPLGVIEGQQ